MNTVAVVIARLMNTPAVVAITAARVRPLSLAQSDDGDGVAITEISNTPVSRATGTNETFRSRVQLDCFSSTYQGAQLLADAVVAALDNYTDAGTVPAIGSCMLESRNDLEGEDVPGSDARRSFGVTLDFILWHGS